MMLGSLAGGCAGVTADASGQQPPSKIPSARTAQMPATPPPERGAPSMREDLDCGITRTIAQPITSWAATRPPKSNPLDRTHLAGSRRGLFGRVRAVKTRHYLAEQTALAQAL